MIRYLRIVFFIVFSFSWFLSSTNLRAQNISGVVNTYINVTNVGINSVTVSNASNYAVGDEVLLIQMKGATITTGNVPTFGTVTALNNAGNFEFATILSKVANTLTFM